MTRMKLKVLALSLVSLFTLAACGGNTNNGSKSSGELPSGGEEVDLTDGEKSASFLANVQGGLNESLSAATGAGISVRFETTTNLAVKASNVEVNVSNAKVNFSLDGKADPAIANAEDIIEALSYLEAVAEYRIGGNYKVNIAMPEYNEAGEQTGTKDANLNLNLNNVGLKAELTGGSIYADLSDRSILNFAVNNYRPVLSFLQAYGGEGVPTEEQLKELLKTDDLGQYATSVWETLHLDKVSISAEELAALTGSSSDSGLVPGYEKLRLEDPVGSQEQQTPSVIEQILFTLAEAKMLQVKEYDKEFGIKFDLTKEKLLEAYKINQYYASHNYSMEGYNSAEFVLPEDDSFVVGLEGVRKLNLSVTAMLDNSYRFTSIALAAEIDATINEIGTVEGERVVEEVATIKGDTSIKLTCDYSGPKVSPAATHNDYTPISSIMAAIETMIPGNGQEE